MLRKLLRHFRPDARADVLYVQIVAQARQPGFYRDLGVPDTADGRFDMIVLHVVLVIRRLRQQSTPGRELAQGVFDAFFADMDRNLREMGTSDMSVPKRVRAMAEAFYGRAAVYDAAIDAASMEGLQAALERNLYADRAGGPDSDTAAIAAMADYVLESGRRLSETSGSDVMAAKLDWPPVPDGTSASAGDGTVAQVKSVTGDDQ